MNLFEFQAKELLTHFGIATPRGRIAETAAEAEKAAERLGTARFVVKVQVRAGERYEAGGIRFAASPAGVRATCDDLVGRQFVTRQTDRAGEPVRWILIEEAIEDAHLLYAGVAVSRSRGELALLVSARGGEGIEQRALRQPELITVHPVRVENGHAQADYAGAVASLEMPEHWRAPVADTLRRMADLAVMLDATQVEINPLAVRPDGTPVALDAKIILDANALVRHPALAALSRAFEAEDSDPDEQDADARRINFVALPGEVGIVANGAGLALATLDLTAEHGASPANFMDIRTTATSLDIAYGIGLILSNPRTQNILVNVHGGGMQRCDTIAEGIAIAMRKSSRRLPIIARLAGNNAEFARKRLLDAGLDVRFCDTMDEAAELAASLSRRSAA